MRTGKFFTSIEVGSNRAARLLNNDLMNALVKSLYSIAQQDPDPLKIKKANALLSELQASILSTIYAPQ